jgi:hypothetical protein
MSEVSTTILTLLNPPAMSMHAPWKRENSSASLTLQMNIGSWDVQPYIGLCMCHVRLAELSSVCGQDLGSYQDARGTPCCPHAYSTHCTSSHAIDNSCMLAIFEIR